MSVDAVPLPEVSRVGEPAEREPGALWTATRVRLAAQLALATVVVYVPLELAYGGENRVALVAAVYGVHALIAASVLALSHTRLGVRCADRLALALALGLTANYDVYFYVWPRHPELFVGSFVCLMLGAAVFFPWSVRRMLVVCGL